MQQRQGPRPPVTLRVTRSTEHGQAAIRLTSPSGGALVLTEAALKGTLYSFAMLVGRNGQLTLPRATMEALSRLGTVEPPPAPSREETP